MTGAIEVRAYRIDLSEIKTLEDYATVYGHCLDTGVEWYDYAPSIQTLPPSEDIWVYCTYKGRTIIEKNAKIYEGKRTNLFFFFIRGSPLAWLPWEDIDLDGKIDMVDITSVCSAFGSTPTHPLWNPLCDFNSDDKIDMVDIMTVLDAFGLTSRPLPSKTTLSLTAKQQLNSLTSDVLKVTSLASVTVIASKVIKGVR